MRKILTIILLLACFSAEAQTPTWLTNWYNHINSTLINGPANGGTKAYIGGLFDTVGSYINQFGGTGAGTVTSVNLNVPTGFSSTGGPITTSGSIALGYASGQPANKFLATPDGTTGALSERSMVSGDLPVVPITKGGTGQTTATNAIQALLPSQSGAAGYAFVSNGTTASWTLLTFAGSVSNTDGTATCSPTTGAVIVSVNQAHSFKFTGTDTFTVAPQFPFTTAGGVFFGDANGNVNQTSAGTSGKVLHGGSSPSYGVVANSDLANSGITINGSGVSLGGSISVGTVTSLSVTATSPVTVNVTNATTTPTIAIGLNGSTITNNTSGNAGTVTNGVYTTTSLGGDLSGNLPNPSLAASGVTAGTYGSATVAVVPTIDAKGRVTNITTVNMTPADTSIAAAYTLTIRDAGRKIHCTNSSNIALTIPSGLATSFTCQVQQEGSGTVTPTTSSTTFNFWPASTTKTAGVGAVIIITSWATANTFTIQGALQ